MSTTARTLARVIAFARSVRSDMPEVDETLAEVRSVLAREGVPYVIVGGVAVLHHGYARTTRDVDVLVAEVDVERIEPALAAAGFERTGPRKWRHVATGAGVDVLVSGDPIPPAGRGTFPDPAAVERSEREGDVAGLSALVGLKLAARRHQDVADVVGLLELLDEADYLRLEATVTETLRPDLARLRADAIEERRGQE